MAENTPDAAAPEERIVPIAWPDVGVAVYTNNLLAQCDGDSIRLLFTQVSPPFFIGEGPEKEKHLANIEHIEAIKVAELVVPLEKFRVMVKMLQDHLLQVDSRASK